MGDSFEEWQLWLFADADHAGEHDLKSTSGCAMFLVGPNTYFPLNAFSKKQTVVANSSTEAEVASAKSCTQGGRDTHVSFVGAVGHFQEDVAEGWDKPQAKHP